MTVQQIMTINGELLAHRKRRRFVKLLDVALDETADFDAATAAAELALQADVAEGFFAIEDVQGHLHGEHTGRFVEKGSVADDPFLTADIRKLAWKIRKSPAIALAEQGLLWTEEDEREHPRDEGGKWTTKGGGEAKSFRDGSGSDGWWPVAER